MNFFRRHLLVSTIVLAALPFFFFRAFVPWPFESNQDRIVGKPFFYGNETYEGDTHPGMRRTLFKVPLEDLAMTALICFPDDRVLWEEGAVKNTWLSPRGSVEVHLDFWSTVHWHRDKEALAALQADDAVIDIGGSRFRLRRHPQPLSGNEAISIMIHFGSFSDASSFYQKLTSQLHASKR